MFFFSACWSRRSDRHLSTFFLVSFLLGAYETTILWFFVGCIAGTVPALWKEAGKKEEILLM